MKLSETSREALIARRNAFVRVANDAKADIERLEGDVARSQKELAVAQSAISDIDRDLKIDDEAE